jgi:hypothetical protein
VLAGGSRERPLMSPHRLRVTLVRTIRHRLGNSRAETFPGAACCTTLLNSMVFRAIMPTAWHSGQKRLPSRPLGCRTPFAVCHFSFSLPGIECIPKAVS